jgi:hypothetical protein
MSNFIFFVLLTVVMAFLMNWVYMSFVYTCPVSVVASRVKATANLAQKIGVTTDEDDIDSFLGTDEE